MTRITVDLVRRRAEHNEGELSTLEEISLHQQDIERIENLSRWCPKLKILYLQGNLIAKIENMSRFKELVYLNLALNNVERVEGLESCESLRKLDLTANFIRESSSLQSLGELPSFKELYMNGNPCTEFKGYRMWVLNCLSVLEELDGQEITRKERIRAMQLSEDVKCSMEEEERQALIRRAQERKENVQKFNISEENEEEFEDIATDDLEKWANEISEHSPEARIAAHRELAQRRRQTVKNKTNEKKEVRLYTKDGRPLNVNQVKVEFDFKEDEEENAFILEVHTYKFLESSLIECDVQPHLVKITIKGKVLQIVLPEEIASDNATALRSQVSGHLTVTMPKAMPVIRPQTKLEKKKEKKVSDENKTNAQNGRSKEYLEIGDPNDSCLYVLSETKKTASKKSKLKVPEERKNSEGFVDNPEVPPLI